MEDFDTVSDVESSDTDILSEDTLSTLTVKQLKELAGAKGYELTGKTKDSIIHDILEQQ